MDAFWQGFEKRAYDYAHEANVLEKGYANRSAREPIRMVDALRQGAKAGALVGGFTGGATGLPGGLKSTLVGTGVGALVGGVAGAGLGARRPGNDRHDIAVAQHIMAMPTAERKAYLKHLARMNELGRVESELDLLDTMESELASKEHHQSKR